MSATSWVSECFRDVGRVRAVAAHVHVDGHLLFAVEQPFGLIHDSQLPQVRGVQPASLCHQPVIDDGERGGDELGAVVQRQVDRAVRRPLDVVSGRPRKVHTFDSGRLFYGFELLRKYL